MSGPTHRPAIVSRNLSLAYGALLVLVCSIGFGWELWASVVGLTVLGIGLTLGSRLWVSTGFAGFVLASGILDYGGGPIEVVLLVLLLAVLSWDAGHRAIDVGAQLCREANTSTVEYLHGGSSAVVGVAVTVSAYSVYSVSGGGRPFATVAPLLVLAIGFTLWASR